MSVADKHDPRAYSNASANFGWASDRPIYEWRTDYGRESAPDNQALEEELFGEENRTNAGINFSRYDTIAVSLKGGPDNFCPTQKFNEISLHPIILENIGRLRYGEPTPIQKNAIPLLLKGHDLLACAQTGSGKTAAFMVPMLSKLLTELDHTLAQRRARVSKATPLALIILPTRELGIQLFDEARRFTYKSPVRPVVIYGGTPMSGQREHLTRGCDVLIATPGRLLDMIRRSAVSLSKVKYLVLDEADRMLDMGFEPIVREILCSTDLARGEDLQTGMFSATFPQNIQVLARDFLKKDFCRLRIGRIGGTTSDIHQKVLLVDEHEKEEVLLKLLMTQPPSRTMIFVDTKRKADYLDDVLFNKQFPCISLHGDRNQRERELALNAFKLGRSPILITTAVASRGLDIKNVLHIINYDLPQDIDEYVHRIGRTARVGNQGLATSFYNERNWGIAPHLTKLLVECDQEIPDFLERFVKTAESYETNDFIDDSGDAILTPVPEHNRERWPSTSSAW